VIGTRVGVGLATSMLLMIPCLAQRTVEAAKGPPPLGPAPRSCPANPLYHTNMTAYAATPERWLMIAHPSINATDYPLSIYDDRYGWAIKYVWFIKPGFHGRITVQGKNLSGGPSLWLGDDLHRRITRVLVLDIGRFLQTSPPIALARNGIHSGLYLQRAGCYRLDATWPGGQWQGVFSFGK